MSNRGWKRKNEGEALTRYRMCRGSGLTGITRSRPAEAPIRATGSPFWEIEGESAGYGIEEGAFALPFACLVPASSFRQLSKY